MLPRYLVRIKEELIYKLYTEYDLTLDEIGQLFSMTRQGVWKAKENYAKKTVDK